MASLAYFTSVTECTHCVQAVGKMVCAKAAVYTRHGLSLYAHPQHAAAQCSVGYSNVYTPRLQSTLETSTQTSSGRSGRLQHDARHVSSPEARARDIEQPRAGEG